MNKTSLFCKRYLPFVGLVAIVGTIAILYTFAASPYAMINSDGWALSGGASSTSFSGASGGKIIKFNTVSAPASSPTPTPSPSPPPTPPPSSTIPDASTTGPTAAGYTLTGYTGPTAIYTAGTVISGKKIMGDIDIYAANVTLKGCDITGTVNIHGVAGTQILDCAIHGSSATDYSQGDGIHTINDVATLTVKRTNIYWTYNDYCELSIGAFDIEDNYFHDAIIPTSNPPHFDGISVWDGPSSGTKIIHNNITIPFSQSTTGIIGFAHDNGDINQLYSNITISNNYFGGTGYIFYPPGPNSQNVNITFNKVTTKWFSKGGAYGVVYKPEQPSWGSNGNVWSDNIWADGPNAGQNISYNE